MADQVIVDGTITFGAAAAGDSFYILEGRQPITGNSDYSGVNTSVAAEISGGFSGSIGTSANPWKTAFSSRLVYQGTGDLYWESNSLDTETTALAQLLGGGHLHVVGAAAIVTRLEGMVGQITVANGVTVTTGRFGGRCSAYLTDTGTGPAITTLQVFDQAFVNTQRPHTTIDLVNGKLVLDRDSAGAVNAHGTVNLFGGRLETIDSGTITTLNWYGGVIDTTKLSRKLTITNTTINMTLPGAQAFLDLATNGQIVFTNTPTRIMSDGRPVGFGGGAMLGVSTGRTR